MASRRRRRGAAPRPALRLPGALEVALVADQQGAALAAPVDHLAQVLDRRAPGRSGWTGELSQSSAGRSGPSWVSESAASTRGAGQRGADLVRRVGELGVDDQVAGPEAELGGQRGDQLLGADHRQHAVDAEPGHAVPAGQPVDGRLPGLEPADGRAGSPASRTPPPAPVCTTSGVGSTGVPTERSTMPSGWARACSAYAVSWSQGKSGSRWETGPVIGAGSLVVLLRRERRDQRVVVVDLADLGRAAGRAEVVEEVDVGVVVAPSTPPGCRPRRRWPRPGRPARRHRSRRTRRGGCRASACPRRCSRPDTRRRRRGP